MRGLLSGIRGAGGRKPSPVHASPNSAARKVATLVQILAAGSKSTSMAWTVLGVSTRAGPRVRLQQRDLGARAVGQRGLDLGAEQVVGQAPRPPRGAARP